MSFFIGICSSHDPSGAGIFLEESILNLVLSTITRSSAVFGGAIYGSKSDLLLSECVFLNNTVSGEGGDIFLLGSNEGSLYKPNILIINESQFLSTTGIFVKRALNASFFMVAFYRLAENLRPQSILVEDCESVSMDSVVVKGFNSGTISPITFRRSGSKTLVILITKLIVSFCHTQTSGGAIRIDGPLKGLIMDSKFLNNTASESGGALFLKNGLNSSGLTISDTIFEANFAEIYGSNLKSLDYIPAIFPRPSDWAPFSGFSARVILLANLAYPYTEETLADLLLTKGLMFFENNFVTQPLEIASGQPIEVVCIVLDGFDNVLYHDNSGKITFKQGNNKETEIEFENEIQRARRGVAIFPKLTLVTEPERNISIVINYYDELNKNSFSEVLNISLRSCVRGEIYRGYNCYKCPENFYSLEPEPMKFDNQRLCLPCPENGICPGGDLIYPIGGYWRMNENQTLMVKCKVSEACPDVKKGDMMSPFSPKCGEFYKDNLCYGCVKGYGKTDSKACILCALNFSYYIRFSLLVLFSLSLSAYQTYTACDFTETWSKRRCLVKLLVDHMTFTGFISRFNVDWTKTILDILTINDSYLTAVPAEMFNFDCLLSNLVEKGNKNHMNSILVSLSPLYYGVLNILLIYFFKIIETSVNKIFKRIKTLHLIRNSKVPIIKINHMIYRHPSVSNPSNEEVMDFHQIIIATCLIIFYNFYPRLLQNGMEWLRCIRLDNSDKLYLGGEPDSICWSDEHMFSLFTAALPTIFGWGLFTPFILFYLTRRMRLRVIDQNETERKQLLEFITIDYKPSFYYWDLFSYCSKFVVVLCSLVTNNFDPASQAAMLILVMLSIFLVQEKLQPYKYQFVNNLRTSSYITTICTSSLAIMASSSSLQATQRRVYFGFLIGFNIVFYSVWGFYFMREGADWEISKSYAIKYWKRFSSRIVRFSKRFSKLRMSQSKQVVEPIQLGDPNLGMNK